MTICSIGKNKKPKPVFVIKLSKNAKPEDIERTNLYATNSLLSKDYHVLVIKSNKNTDIEFELFNVSDLSLIDFEKFKLELTGYLKDK
jgi:hypothetical protein